MDLPTSPTDRRGFLRIATGASMAAFLAACTKGSVSVPPTPTSATGGPTGPQDTLSGLSEGLRQVSVQSAVQAPVNPGKQMFTFIVAENSGALITGAPAQVYFAVEPGSKAEGPFDATWQDFTGYAATNDQSPESPLTGVYFGEIDVPAAPPNTVWTVLVKTAAGGDGVGGVTHLQTTKKPVVAALGSKATSVKTPVATDPKKVAEICTRKPPCPLHAISLDDALRDGKPTVVTFATPLLCESMLCGPVVDEVMLVAQHEGSKVNVIHVEEFLPGKDLQPPPATLQNVSPAFKAWGFQDEPWVIVIDARGTIRGRLGPGATVALEIEQILRPLL
jgi:hypothetical protein